MKKYFISFIFLYGLFFSPYAWACSCAPGSPTPLEAFQDAKAVFIGHVYELQKDTYGYAEEVVLKVGKVWKGEPGETFHVGSLRRGCSYWNFEENKSYLIYAHPTQDKDDPDGYAVSVCSRTKPLDKGQIETKYLDAILAGNDLEEIDNSLPNILLHDESPNVRVESAYILGQMLRESGEPLSENILEALIKATSDPNKQVKIAAVNNLENYRLKGTPGLKEALLNLLQDDDSAVRGSASSALSVIAQHESDAFKGLKKAFEKAISSENKQDLKEYEGSIVSLSVSLAQVAGSEEEKKEVVDLVFPVLDDIHNPYWKVSVIQHLGFLKEHALKIAPKLIEELKKSDDYHVKQYMINALADIGAKDALEIIKSYLNDENCNVVSSTIEAVYKIDPQGFGDFFSVQAMPVMKGRFDQCGSNFIWGPQSIGAAAKDMGPFLKEKYENLQDNDWTKGLLKNLFDSWQ